MVSVHFPTRKEIVDFFVGSLYWIEVTNRTALILSVFGIVLIAMLLIVLAEVSCSCSSLVCPGLVWKLKAWFAKSKCKTCEKKSENFQGLDQEFDEVDLELEANAKVTDNVTRVEIDEDHKEDEISDDDE